MLTSENLYSIAKCRYEEAKILLANHKPDGAIYLCGYALELILKRHIVRVLEWDGYPSDGSDFKDLTSFKVHKLDTLLRLAGLEKKIKSDNAIFAQWLRAKVWDSEIRYKQTGQILENEAQDTIDATRDTINFIIKSS